MFVECSTEACPDYHAAVLVDDDMDDWLGCFFCNTCHQSLTQREVKREADKQNLDEVGSQHPA